MLLNLSYLLFFSAAAPNIIASPLSIVVAPNSSVDFSCDASGVPLTISWQKDGITISPESEERLQVINTLVMSLTESMLLIANVTTADEGNYTCTAANSLGTAVSTGAILTIQGIYSQSCLSLTQM